MTTPPSASRTGRETRLLLVTIAISVAVLLLLARFRFPDSAADQPAESAPAPLERLAAQATYDELASIMADLERRIAPRIWIMRAADEGVTPGALVAAPRLTPDRAVALLDPGQAAGSATPDAQAEVVGEDPANGLTVLRVPAMDDGAVPIRTGAPRPGPRYVAVAEATAQGAVLRPVYVGRMQPVPDPRTGTQQLSLTALQHAIPRGAAIFSLDGSFVGLVRDTGSTVTVLTAEFLRAAVEGAQPAAAGPRGSLGVEVDALSPALGAATGATSGVVVTYVEPEGPAGKAVQSGDVIQSLDSTPVTSVAEFRRLESSRAPGATVAVAGTRRGSPLQASLTAVDAAAPPPAAGAGEPGFIGRNVPGAGIEIVTVRPGSAAAAAGLQPRDLIVALDGQQAPNSATLARRYRGAAEDAAVLLTVKRGERHHVLALEKR